jgi:putative transposase
MPYTRVFIHYVWSTKKRVPVLTPNIRRRLFLHIRQYAQDKDICIDRINGHHDHVHCLVLLQTGQTVEGVIKLIKGESAHWFNATEKAAGIRLEWQSEYFAVGVSETGLDALRTYIDNQEEYHRSKTFEQEYTEFLMRYGFLSSRD